MLLDADNAIAYIFDNIHTFGGDPKNITLSGQVRPAIRQNVATKQVINKCIVSWCPYCCGRFSTAMQMGARRV